MVQMFGQRFAYEYGIHDPMHKAGSPIPRHATVSMVDVPRPEPTLRPGFYHEIVAEAFR